jgi:hypothetical protein
MATPPRPPPSSRAPAAHRRGAPPRPLRGPGASPRGGRVTVRAFLPWAGAGAHRGGGRGARADRGHRPLRLGRRGRARSRSATASPGRASPGTGAAPTTPTASRPARGLRPAPLRRGPALARLPLPRLPPREVEGVAGVQFAVWAPNAERVSVVGDFNGWDGRGHPMRVRGGSGVWELFIPGIGARRLLQVRDARPRRQQSRQDRPLRQRLPEPAGDRRVHHRPLAPSLGRRGLDEAAGGDRLAAPPLVGLRGAPGLLAARTPTAASSTTGSSPSSSPTT